MQLIYYFIFGSALVLSLIIIITAIIEKNKKIYAALIGVFILLSIWLYYKLFFKRDRHSTTVPYIGRQTRPSTPE